MPRDCSILISQMNVPTTMYFDEWIWLLTSNIWETPTSTDVAVHIPVSLSDMKFTVFNLPFTQHLIKRTVFTFRVCVSLGSAHLYIHALLNESCELWLSGIFFTPWLNYLRAGESFMRIWSEIVGWSPMWANDYGEFYLLLHRQVTGLCLAFSYSNRD